MSIDRKIPFSMLVSRRELHHQMFYTDAGKFSRDRNDVYLLDLDSIQEDAVSFCYCVSYDILTVNINPDFDW
jgi:hypothetical protein